MNIYLTFDYEIYFGENHGTVEKCILQPTEELMRIGKLFHIPFVFFVDCGFILKLDEYRKKYSRLEKDYEGITSQIKRLVEEGHDVQLHIHPHWVDSYYNGEKWIIDVRRYKLADFDGVAIADIVRRYKKVLTELTGKKIFAYRAGGWCLQPFERLRNAFLENEISLDSSVFRNGYFFSEQYSYDYRNAPDTDIYRFDSDPVTAVENGFFTEVPISAIRNSPLFFWKLFFLGRKDPYLHKPLGDGRAMAAPGYRKKLLTRFTNNPVSMDGYNSVLLQKALSERQRKNAGHMVVIGHPKALSRFSFQQISAFAERNLHQHKFTTFTREFLK
jgi:hypothetical protein